MKDKILYYTAKALFVWTTALLTIEVALIIHHLFTFGI